MLAAGTAVRLVSGEHGGQDTGQLAWRGARTTLPPAAPNTYVVKASAARIGLQVLQLCRAIVAAMAFLGCAQASL